MNRREFLFSLGMLGVSIAWAKEEKEKPRCSICGMFVEENSPISFKGDRNGQPVLFCSFSCAHAFHKKYPDATLTTFDYHSHQAIPADKAYFLIKSEKLASEYKFAMAPVVTSFATEQGAKMAKERVKEGEIVAGFSAVAKIFGR